MPTLRNAISKTDYLNWRACPAWAWTALHRPSTLPAEDPADRRKALDGDRVETLARGLFPEGILVDAFDPHAAARLTADLMASGVTTLFQATVATETGLIARADVLVRDGDAWHVIEIKSSAADPASTRSVVKRYLPDIAFQLHAFDDAGIDIGRASLLHIDKRYRHNGALDLDTFLALTDVTDAVRNDQPATARSIKQALADLQPGYRPPCECHRKTRSNRCPLFATFHPEVPATDTIYHISGIHRPSLLAALDRGVMRLRDWPDDLPLSSNQRRQVDLARRGTQRIDRDRLARFLDRLTPPLWFLDYETYQEPVPRWSGHAPHQQVPFQFSLHVVDESGDHRHHDWLATDRGSDPVRDLLAALSETIGDEGSVLVWNQGFEELRNREMAALHPEYAPFLLGVNRRMHDLALIVSKGMVEHPRFNGSWSLKSVVPVIAPELDYGALDIGHGSLASERWMQAMIDDPCPLSPDDVAGTFAALRTYCHQDTLALVRIWEYALQIVND